MALTKPTLFSIASFDATQSATFTFNVLGGSQVVKNSLYIYQGETLIHTNTQVTYTFTNTINANVLTNGETYTAYVVTYDAQGNGSLPSNSITFTCYSQPDFILDDITPNSSTLNFTINYDQDEDETLSSYEFNLYDSNGRLINSSNVIQTGNPAMVLGGLSYSYTFTGFINNTIYYIEVLGQTAGGTQLTTGRIEFVVQYEQPSFYQQLQLINNCDKGNITISSNVTAILGTTNPDPPIYVDNNTAIDLRQDGSFVKWQEGVNIDGNWTMGIWCRRINPNTDLVTMKNIFGDDITISLYFDGAYYTAVLRVGRDIKYIIASNVITISSDDENVFIWVRRIDNIYDIVLENLG